MGNISRSATSSITRTTPSQMPLSFQSSKLSDRIPLPLPVREEEADSLWGVAGGGMGCRQSPTVSTAEYYQVLLYTQRSTHKHTHKVQSETSNENHPEPGLCQPKMNPLFLAHIHTRQGPSLACGSQMSGQLGSPMNLKASWISNP